MAIVSASLSTTFAVTGWSFDAFLCTVSDNLKKNVAIGGYNAS
jgi:hypothetical protein